MAGPLLISGLAAGYRGRPVVRDFGLPPIAAGEVLSLIGPNAAGKSTLLRALAGLIAVRGSAVLDGRDLLRLPLAERARMVTYMPQSLPQRVALRVLETVIGALRASPLDLPVAVEDAATLTLERVGILDLAMEPLDRLSGGQRQLVSLAQALARNPRILLLDEPTSALDLRHQLRVMRLVRELSRERGMITVLVLHDLGLAARWSDRVAVLSHGKLAAHGTPEAAITPAVLAEVYGVAARVERCSHGTLQVIVDDTPAGAA